MRNRVRLTEGMLRNVIKESVKRILKEEMQRVSTSYDINKCQQLFDTRLNNKNLGYVDACFESFINGGQDKEEIKYDAIDEFIDKFHRVIDPELLHNQGELEDALGDVFDNFWNKNFQRVPDSAYSGQNMDDEDDYEDENEFVQPGETDDF